jgi:transcriptional regulator of acetoin/glycerol metabolism
MRTGSIRIRPHATTAGPTATYLTRTKTIHQGEVQRLRVEGDAERPIDERVVTATHRDLRGQVAAGRFREVLEQTGGARSEAARIPEVDRTTLYRRIRRLDIR